MQKKRELFFNISDSTHVPQSAGL